METTIRFQGREIKAYAEGDVISDYQVLRALRQAGAIPDDRNAYSIGVPASICHNERTPSGKLSARIVDDGPISIDGFVYRSHSFGLADRHAHSGQITWSFQRA